MTDSSTRPPISTGLKLAIDFGPLLVLFVGFRLGGPFVATAAFMAATALAMAVSWWMMRRIPPALIFTGVIVAVLGGLTLWLHDETFLKLKPTLIYGFFAIILLIGWATKKPYLKLIFGDALPDLDDAGWQKLTRNWALFFLAMMATNEAARHFLTTSQWFSFKVWGMTIITAVFAVAQAPLLARHGVKLD